MNVTSHLAWRNLWRHGRRTWLTVGAMIFCNALLVFLVSFQFGQYSMMINNTLSILTGHIQIQQKQYNEDPRMRFSVPDGITLAQELRAETGIQSIAARGTAFALASSEERSFGIQILGVQAEYEPLVSTLPGLVNEGRYLNNNDAAEIVIGAILARNLKVGLGDEVTFLGSGRDGSFAAGVATVVGVIHSELTELDRSVAQIPLGYFQSMFSMDDYIHSIVLDTGSLDSVTPIKTQLENLIRMPDIAVLDWNELQPGLRQAILADMVSAFVMYAVLIVLVAFSVLNTQLMSVLERTREFGVIMALGLRPGKLMRLIFLETSMMSLLGLVLGCLLGTAISVYFQINGVYIPGMEEIMDKYNLPSELYPQVSLLSVLLGPVTVFAGGILAAIYPALRLHSLQPVAAMRAA